jgi:predicted alpha/beta hydrolase family esterase
MKRVLFLQGAGEGAYVADKLLADSLRQALGAGYEVRYPAMPDEDNAPYEQWKKKVETALAVMEEPIILAGHSIGASHLAKILTEIEIEKQVAGIFLLAAPFWGGDGWRYEGYDKLELPKDAATKLPKGSRVFIYHARDDEVAPYGHLALYSKLLPQATTRTIERGGHQFNDDLSAVARDMKSL